MGEVLVGRTEELARLRAWLDQRLADPGPRGGPRAGPAPPLLLVSGEAWVGVTALVDAAVAAYDASRVVRLDDLHVADGATVRGLPDLARRLVDGSTAVVATYRPDALARDHPLRPVRAELRHAGLVTELRLGPLPDADARRLVADRFGPAAEPDRVEAVVRRADGLPFLLVALAQDDDGDLPEAVRDAVALELERLDDAGREALRLAAVTGPAVEPRHLAALLPGGWPEELGTGEHLARDADGVLRFRHDVVREAVHDQVPPARQRAWATRLADRLLATGSHRDARALLDPLVAAWPADEPGRARALTALAAAAEGCGEHPAAVAALGELLAGAPEPERAGLLSRLATQHELLGQWSVAVAEREAGARLHDAAGRPADAAVERLAVAVHLRSAASLRAALEVTALAERDARRADRLDLVCRAEALRGNLLARTERGAEGVAQVRAALDRALSAGLVAPAAEAYQRLADALEHSGDYRSAGQAYDAAYTFCRHGDQDVTAQVCRACAAVVMLHGGRWDTALEVCAEVLHDPGSPPPARAAAEVVTGLVEAFRGRVRGPRAALLGARLTGVRIDLLPVDLLASWGLSLLDRHAGDDAGAVAGLQRVLQRCEDSQERHYCVPVLQDAVGLFARLGLHREVARATALLAEADLGHQPDARIALCVALAETSALAGDVPAAVPHLRQALELSATEELPLADLAVRRRLAALLVAGGGPDDARAEAVELLRQAQRTARRLKARLLLEPLGRELAALGAVPTTAGGDALTAREREVLGLVGGGLTSREIAARLFLSVRTVEMHVRHAMTTLDCRTRTEAAMRLARDDAHAHPTP
ncbi:hypothetical protein ASG49_14990 [Marmoricola sp. Leaf446]|uniref:LuxR C-terminal-related transcriptional regulator n=1 Tax=Marmoricola sp. Leaf446 TaxID=1736379 RepID=UPI0006FB3B66|nr:LuxR C-terminal-related transcriptional regulator [Marmoricola sp. Leaf446]KQT89125.1 hypothetical protein ASG49_14990 [Marmoricola sp. Leaf446]